MAFRGSESVIIVADALHIPLADNTVQCVVTSPPYWGLRDYGVDGQLGLEPTPEEYVGNMVTVFREVWRVLKDDGVLWLNLGDSYSAGSNNPSPKPSPKHSSGNVGRQRKVDNIRPKNLLGVPWRTALALQSDGWYLRSDIIWAKPNPMPESVKDRPTRSHEYIFLLTKSERYYYDADAIKEPGSFAGPSGPGTQKTPHAQGFGRRTREEEIVRQDKQRGHGDRWDAMSKEEQTDLMRNKRSVWNIATRPYPEAHYAVFPEEIPKICILASTKKGDIVLDPFGGSGTTGRVAWSLGRKGVCMDISGEYAHNHMKQRMQVTVGMF